LAADTDFSDFLIPMGENGEDFDFGTAAMRMLEGIRRNDEDDPRNQRIEEVEEPESPTPGGLGGGMILTDEPKRSGGIRRDGDVKQEANEELDGLDRPRRSRSVRQPFPKAEVKEEPDDEVKEEKSEELEYVDVDQLKEEE
jgi:hypothetical protein